MAKNKGREGKIGPSQGGDGNPPNPSDAIQTTGVPIRHFSTIVERKPFSIPYCGKMHRADGPGNDEFNQPTAVAGGHGSEDKV